MVEKKQSPTSSVPLLQLSTPDDTLRASAKNAVRKLLHEDSKRTSMVLPKLVREKKWKRSTVCSFCRKLRNGNTLLESALWETRQFRLEIRF